MTTQLLEVHLETLGQHSWFQLALSALAAGPAYDSYRFVARSADDDSGNAPAVVESGTFLLLRFMDPDALVEPASPDVTQRLAELDSDLVATGWRRQETLGRYWWSRIYQQIADVLADQRTWKP